jgi:hypothetical protein
MARTAEEIYQDALKLTPDEREILEVLLRLSLPLPRVALTTWKSPPEQGK